MIQQNSKVYYIHKDIIDETKDKEINKIYFLGNKIKILVKVICSRCDYEYFFSLILLNGFQIFYNTV